MMQYAGAIAPYDENGRSSPAMTSKRNAPELSLPGHSVRELGRRIYFFLAADFLAGAFFAAFLAGAFFAADFLAGAFFAAFAMRDLPSLGFKELLQASLRRVPRIVHRHRATMKRTRHELSDS